MTLAAARFKPFVETFEQQSRGVWRKEPLDKEAYLRGLAKDLRLNRSITHCAYMILSP